ncbi:MAG: tetratricopeptide repeat protein, partial [Dehalococcoidia bacterium]|nr:tetratricopeptide repeat protein [Dehalococcoidia bacterium]
ELYDAYYNRGVAYFAKLDMEKTAADMDAALKINHNLAPAYNYRGQIYLYESDLDSALESFDKAIEKDPDMAEAYKFRGLIHIAKKQSAAALADLNKSIELDDSDAMAYYYRGNADNANEDFDAALKDLNRAIALVTSADTTTFGPFKHDVDGMYLERAIAYRGKQQLTQAVADARKAVELNPTYAPSQVTLGEFLTVNGDIEEGIKVLTQAIKLDPTIAEAYINRAVAYEILAVIQKDNGWYVYSAEDLRKAVELSTDQQLIDAANEGIRKMQSKGYIP